MERSSSSRQNTHYTCDCAIHVDKWPGVGAETGCDAVGVSVDLRGTPRAVIIVTTTTTLCEPVVEGYSKQAAARDANHLRIPWPCRAYLVSLE